MPVHLSALPQGTPRHLPGRQGSREHSSGLGPSSWRLSLACTDSAGCAILPGVAVLPLCRTLSAADEGLLPCSGPEGWQEAAMC